jgi:hypothetical protein
VRNAQRSYQKRKDEAACSVNQRCEDLLQILSDLSIEVDLLLQIAARTGAIADDGELGYQLRRVWKDYDTAVNADAVLPDLRFLQTKNDRRKDEYGPTILPKNTNRVVIAASNSGPAIPKEGPVAHSDLSDLNLNLVRGDDSTMIQSFKQISGSKTLNGRSYYQVLADRQAEYTKPHNAGS